MRTRVGLIFGGCGWLDGTDTHEAVGLLVALDRRGHTPLCMAPDVPQVRAVNHRTRSDEPVSRNVLDESARLCHAKIVNTSSTSAQELSALIIPGGYGAAKNLLCAYDGGMHPHVARLIQMMYKARKPVAFSCVAPLLVSQALKDLGLPADLAPPVEAAPVKPRRLASIERAPLRVVEEHRLVISPPLPSEAGPYAIHRAAEELVEQLLKLVPLPMAA